MKKSIQKAIKNWIHLPKNRRSLACPFIDMAKVNEDEEYCHAICKKMFPRAVPDNPDIGYYCPCDVYNKEYVVRKVKKLLKENPTLNPTKGSIR